MIKDAPWIVDAMLNGMDAAPIVKCPCCGKEAETFYTDDSGIDIFGCENCIKVRDTADYPAYYAN